MDKHIFLESVKESAKTGLATESEVVAAYREGAGVIKEDIMKLGLSQILSYLGGGIVALGVAIFVGQNWDTLNVFTHIATTFGIGVIAFSVGNVLLHTAKKQLGLAMHLIAFVTLTIGTFVVFDAIGWDVSQSSAQSLIFAGLFGMYITAYRTLKYPFFALGSILFGSAFFVSVTNLMNESVWLDDFGSYQFLIVGLTWILLGFSWSNAKESSLTPYLYFFGLPMFFISTLVLGGDPPTENWLWIIAFPALTLGSIVFSLPLKSRLFLVWGAFFLVIDIFKITGNYFSESFGWPLALVIAGLGLMGVGTLVVRVNRQYTTQGNEMDHR